MNWLGAGLLVFGFYFCGLAICEREKERLIALDSIIDLLSFLNRRVEAERMPLYLIFCNYKNEYLESVGFLGLIRSCRGGVEGSWESALKLLPVSAEVARELGYFGKTLGLLAYADQTERIKACISFLKEERATLLQTLPPRQKSIKSVSVLCGSLLAIILI